MNAPAGRTSVAIWIALVAAGSGLAFAARGSGPLPGDLLLTRLLQRSFSGGFANFLLMRAGDLIWFLPPLAILVALVGRWWLAALFVFLAGATGVLIPDAIKLLVALPRPAADLVRVLGPQGNYGFPSGTAFLSVVLLGMIGYLIRRRRRSVAVVVSGVLPLLVLLIGLSRVYAGEHWATDVLGGWLFGDAWLLFSSPIAGGCPDRRSRNVLAGNPTARRRTLARRLRRRRRASRLRASWTCRRGL
jgi:membrane-associated phospholipid phosphatase